MTSVIVDYTFNNVLLTFYIQQLPPNVAEPRVIDSPTFPLNGNGALITR